jgi:hypothetical protein
MSQREAFISAVDYFLLAGAGAAMLFFAGLAALAVFRGYVYINGKKATKLEEPVGYLIVLISFCGLSYLFSVPFIDGLKAWLG